MTLEERSRATKTRLDFSDEARPLLTDFRIHALETIYESARKELGDLLIQASVSVYHDHYEPVPPILVLGIVADIDGEAFGRIHRAVVKAIMLEELLWSDAEKAEFTEAIHFELVPLKV
jgi:hypothetical protein